MRVYPHHLSIPTHPVAYATACRVAMPKHLVMESVNSSLGALSTIVDRGNRKDKHGVKKSGGKKGRGGNKKNSNKEERRLLREYSKALALAIYENERENDKKRTSGVGGGVVVGGGGIGPSSYSLREETDLTAEEALSTALR